MNEPEALRLADYLETYGPSSNIEHTSIQAAIELRRLHEANAELLEALQKLTDYAERNGALVGWARAAIAKHGGH